MILMEVSSRLPGLEHAQYWRIALPDATMTGNGEQFPLALFFHDLGYDGTQLAQLCRLPRLVDQTGWAILLPNGNRSCFTDMRYGPHWRTYLTEGLLPFVSRSFPVANTAVAIGLGTGGWAAAHLLDRCPERISAAIAFNASPDLPESWTDDMNLSAVFGEKSNGDSAAYALNDKTRASVAWLSADEDDLESLMITQLLERKNH